MGKKDSVAETAKKSEAAVKKKSNVHTVTWNVKDGEHDKDLEEVLAYLEETKINNTDFYRMAAKEFLRQRKSAAQQFGPHFSQPQNLLQATKDLRPFGLVDIIAPANGHNYVGDFDTAESIDLVFNDMRMFLINHDAAHVRALKRRIAAKKKTRIFLLHPKNPNMQFVADISGKPLKGQTNEIGTAVRKICENVMEKSTDDFKIIGHRLFNTYTLVMSESKCMIVYYPISKRHNDGIIYVFGPGEHRDNIYNGFKADLDNLEQVSGPDNHADWDLIEYYLKSIPGKPGR